jgi:two-component system response regulator FixJ
MSGTAIIFIADDDEAVRDSLKLLLETSGYAVRVFPSGGALLAALPPGASGCVLLDIHMPELGGLEVQREIARRGVGLPVIVITGQGEVPLAVAAMKAGAVDFIEKPYDDRTLLAPIDRALRLDRASHDDRSAHAAIRDRAARLTGREREVLGHLVAGRPNKVIAHSMAISPRTVEIHRSRVMEKMQAHSLPDLVRMALLAHLLEAPPA